MTSNRALYSFDGRPVTIRSGASGVYPADFPIVFNGTAKAVEPGFSDIDITLVDKAFIFDRPVLSTKFLGTNSGSTGLEGLPGDLKGKPVPRLYGKAENFSPPEVNYSKKTRRVSDRPVTDITAVYDRGVALTKGTNYANSTDLKNATVPSSTYATCFAEGLFRLGSTPVGQVTADAVEDAQAYNMTAGELLGQLATDAGLQATEVSGPDIGELNSAGPYVVGLWLNDETTFRSAMDQIVGSIGAYWTFDGNGVFRCGQLREPSGTPDAYIIAPEVLAGFQRQTADRAGIPYWRITVRYRKFFTTQTDVAGSATRPTEVAQEYRTVTVEDPAVKIQWSQAGELVVDTLLTDPADALAEANRLLAIHKVRRDRFDVPIHISVFTQKAFKLMQTVNLTYGRFGLSAGRNFVVLGISLQLKDNRVTLSLWG